MLLRSARPALLVLLVCAAGGVGRADGLADRGIERAAARSSVFKDTLKGRVSVRAENGVVLLSGRVPTPDDRTLAEDTVTLLPNVRRVDNQIEVDGPPVRRSDGWIALHVRAALLLHRDVSAAATRVDVKDGEVILEGHAATSAQKELTGMYARKVEGVRAVLNEMVVDHPPPAAPAAPGAHPPATFAGDGRPAPAAAGRTWDDPAITAQVRYELLQHHIGVGPRLRVTTHAGVVTISGEADNQDEKELIGQAAASAPGVRAVNNQLHVPGQ